MNRPYIILTLVVFVSIQTAARNYFDLIALRNSIRQCSTSDVPLGLCGPYDECSRYLTVYSAADDIIKMRYPQIAPCPPFPEEVCCDYEDVELNPIDQEPISSRGWCGWHNPTGVGYQSAGNSNHVAKFGEFPWTVIIMKGELKEHNYSSTSENCYLGGGSLIHPSVVLTAAQVTWGESLMVRAGEWNTQSEEEVYPHQDKSVREVVFHKDFNRGNLVYDIALLFLQEPMLFASNVGVVCLPPPGLRPANGSKCFASGWGMDKFGKEEQLQLVVKKVEVPVVDRNVCLNHLSNTSLGSHINLHTSLMCAGGEPGTDTCMGDGGSSLVCPIDHQTNRYMQSGIVSWGLGCGHDGTPGVYVDVAELREWIDNEVVNRGLSPDFYTFE